MQQKFLTPQAAAVAGEGVVRPQHPVAGNQDTHRIATHRLPHGLCRHPAAPVGLQKFGDESIGHGLSIGNGLEGLPHRLLKVRPLRADGRQLGRFIPGKIALQPAAGLPQHGRGRLLPPMPGEIASVGKVDTGEILPLPGQPQGPQRGWHIHPVHGFAAFFSRARMPFTGLPLKKSMTPLTCCLVKKPLMPR